MFLRTSVVSFLVDWGADIDTVSTLNNRIIVTTENTLHLVI